MKYYVPGEPVVVLDGDKPLPRGNCPGGWSGAPSDGVFYLYAPPAGPVSAVYEPFGAKPDPAYDRLGGYPWVRFDGAFSHVIPVEERVKDLAVADLDAACAIASCVWGFDRAGRFRLHRLGGWTDDVPTGDWRRAAAELKEAQEIAKREGEARERLADDLVRVIRRAEDAEAARDAAQDALRRAEFAASTEEMGRRDLRDGPLTGAGTPLGIADRLDRIIGLLARRPA